MRIEELSEDITELLDNTIATSLIRKIKAADEEKEEPVSRYFSELLLLHSTVKQINTNFLRDVVYGLITIAAAHPEDLKLVNKFFVTHLINRAKEGKV